jgi:small GTP-binding protein
MKIVQKKVCLLGDFAVGKTSLVRRFVEGRFDARYLSTLGVKVSRKPLERPYGRLNLIVWDLAGSEDYNADSSYLLGAAGGLVVCDLTRRRTLATLERYTQQLRSANPAAQLVYLANKCDLTAEREIAATDLHALCAEYLNGPYLLTSALTGEGVESAFAKLADLIEV